MSGKKNKGIEVEWVIYAYDIIDEMRCVKRPTTYSLASHLVDVATIDGYVL